jgi:DNA helicase-2/ATP-dependent DNA helicase PcrA
MRSRFFDELPEHTLKWLTPKRPGFGDMAQAAPSWNQRDFNTPARPIPSHGAAAAVPRQADPGHGLRVRMKVFHTKFGEGTVLTLEGAGADARAQIDFPRHGTKWLALSVAKLTPVP